MQKKPLNQRTKLRWLLKKTSSKREVRATILSVSKQAIGKNDKQTQRQGKFTTKNSACQHFPHPKHQTNLFLIKKLIILVIINLKEAPNLLISS